MPAHFHFDKLFDEDEIDIIIEAVMDKRNEAERSGDEKGLIVLDELCEKLGFWS